MTCESLYLDLCRHPGRTVVFVNAVTAVRRVAAILKTLGLPAHALHAQQQQRQRLKVRMKDTKKNTYGSGKPSKRLKARRTVVAESAV